jgi:hypothetical protein
VETKLPRSSSVASVSQVAHTLSSTPVLFLHSLQPLLCTFLI